MKARFNTRTQATRGTDKKKKQKEKKEEKKKNTLMKMKNGTPPWKQFKTSVSMSDNKNGKMISHFNCNKNLRM